MFGCGETAAKPTQHFCYNDQSDSSHIHSKKTSDVQLQAPLSGTGASTDNPAQMRAPSGVPPMPSSRSAAAPALATSMAAATSPSEMSLMRHPVSRHSLMMSACLGLHNNEADLQNGLT